MCSPSETHPESLPPPLVFALLYIYISGCKMLSSSLPLPILHMEVMDGKEIQKIEVGGDESVKEDIFLAVSQFIFHIMAVGESGMGTLRFLFGVATVLPNHPKQ